MSKSALEMAFDLSPFVTLLLDPQLASQKCGAQVWPLTSRAARIQAYLNGGSGGAGDPLAIFQG